MEKTQLTVAKCTEEELNAVREFLQNLRDIINENEQFEIDEEVNSEIADVARLLPERAFIVPLNLGILLDNYQDKESDILEHPKWILDLISENESLKKEIEVLKTKTAG